MKRSRVGKVLLVEALKRCQEESYLGARVRAVQRCRLAVTESPLQHLMDEVRRRIARGIPEPATV